jgi:hypothetical protein
LRCITISTSIITITILITVIIPVLVRIIDVLDVFWIGVVCDLIIIVIIIIIITIIVIIIIIPIVVVVDPSNDLCDSAAQLARRAAQARPVLCRLCARRGALPRCWGDHGVSRALGPRALPRAVRHPWVPGHWCRCCWYWHQCWWRQRPWWQWPWRQQRWKNESSSRKA